MSATPINLVFILSDDQGPWALGCAGNDEIQTPVLDELASKGTRLTNFFCTSPVCSPARASLLTGTIPSQHGVHDYLEGRSAGADGLDFLEDQPLLTDVFSEAGYRIGLVGKWHLGASDRPRPGFESWFSIEGGSSPYYGAKVFRGTQAETVDGYLTDALAGEALSFLEGCEDDARPFCLFLHFTAPHKPWAGQHPETYRQLYADCEFNSCPQETPHPWLATHEGKPIASEPNVREALIGYFASITAMDSAIGTVLDKLVELGVADRTLISFMSDNGFNAGHHGVWGKGNGTLPLNMYDTSVKVPAIFRLHGVVRAGAVEAELASGYDVAATLLDLAGLEPGPLEAGPGRSFANVLRGDGPSGGRRVVVYDEYGSVRMIRDARWKYVHRYPLGPHELYDLQNDPNERQNLVDDDSHIQTQRELRHSLHLWFRTHCDPTRDGATLPVSGGGQIDRVDREPLDAFAPRGVS